MSMVWRPIVGFEDCGKVSNTGLIRNKHGLIRKTTVGKNGYERVGFHGGQETVFVHRLVARAFCDGYADGLEINHKDGDKLNNNADNLEWVTHSENVKHSFDALGKKSPSQYAMKVPVEDIPVIQERRNQGETFQSIAGDYGVTAHAIMHKLSRAKGGVPCQH